MQTHLECCDSHGCANAILEADWDRVETAVQSRKRRQVHFSRGTTTSRASTTTSSAMASRSVNVAVRARRRVSRIEIDRKTAGSGNPMLSLNCRLNECRLVLSSRCCGSHIHLTVERCCRGRMVSQAGESGVMRVQAGQRCQTGHGCEGGFIGGGRSRGYRMRRLTRRLSRYGHRVGSVTVRHEAVTEQRRRSGRQPTGFTRLSVRMDRELASGRRRRMVILVVMLQLTLLVVIVWVVVGVMIWYVNPVSLVPCH